MTLFLGGSLLLGVGAFELPPSFALSGALEWSLGLLAIGLVAMVFGMVTYVRMRTRGAIIAESRRRALEEPARAHTAPDTDRLPDDPSNDGAVVVDMAPFASARRADLARVKTRLTLLVAGFAAAGGFLVFEAVESSSRGDAGFGVGVGLFAVLVLLIAALLAAIVFRPDWPDRPARLEIGESGLRLTRNRGASAQLLWGDPSLLLFLIDTRPSVRRVNPDGLPVLWLHSKPLGTVPLSVTGAESVRSRARQRGLRVDELPQGQYGSLPRRIRMNLPFGSVVSTISPSRGESPSPR